ncbi:MAG: response regulator [Comamonas sp.]|nr:response regulator [Comamonas sp.]
MEPLPPPLQQLQALTEAIHEPATPSTDEPLAALIAELRNYQAELEVQNQVLNYSQAVAESASERFEALFASVPLPLLVLDGAHDIVIQANAMALKAFQRPGSERLLASFMPFVCQHDGARVIQAFEQARRSGRSEAHEVLFTLGDASHMQGDLHIACIEIPQQEGPASAQFMCAIVDQGPLLAERRTLQERNHQLRTSQRRLEGVINASMDAIISADQHLRITVCNPSAARLFDCPAQQVLGSHLQRFFPQIEQFLPPPPHIAQLVVGEMPAYTAAQTPVEVEVSLAFEQDPQAQAQQGQYITVFARDLSGSKQAEAQRSALEAQLRESHKMQALGTMAGGIAHDFNNIVGAILGNVELAKADGLHHPQLLESLLEIEKAGRRARDLVRQILTFSRNEPPARRAVHAQQALHDAERLLRVGLPPNIELHFHADPHLPPMLADPTQVEQALFNLTNNAIHALGQQRGWVNIQACLCQATTALVERFGLNPGQPYIAISVQDNGPGMNQNTLERVFEPFYTTKPVGQGTGLGLAVVHGLMRTHEGAVEVSTQLGAGSCFTLYFPLLPSSTAAIFAAPRLPRICPELAVPPLAASLSPASLGQEDMLVALHTAPEVQQHIMYVDDDLALVSLVLRLLRRRGYQVSGFDDPHAALQALEQSPSGFDLLVTDYNMPGYSGLDLLKAVKRIRPDLPVALASGYVTSDISEQALAAGARALIHKPNDVSELCAIVDQLLQPPPAPWQAP